MIKTVAGAQEALQTYKTNQWIRNSEIGLKGVKSELTLQDAPSIPFENRSIQKTFAEILTDSIGKVNSLQKEANVAIEQLASGKSKNLHETMLMVEQAEIAFKTMNQIRLKVLDAYKEVMRMQV